MQNIMEGGLRDSREARGFHHHALMPLLNNQREAAGVEWGSFRLQSRGTFLVFSGHLISFTIS